MDNAPVIEEALFGPGLEMSGYALFLTPDAEYDDSWGGGIALDYYFNTNFALGASAEWADVEAPGGSSSVGGVYAANATYRFPIGMVAPYLLVGGGVQDFGGSTEITARGGAGLQVALTSQFGLFGDWIYNFPGGGGGDDDFQDFQEVRFGLRFAF